MSDPIDLAAHRAARESRMRGLFSAAIPDAGRPMPQVNDRRAPTHPHAEDMKREELAQHLLEHHSDGGPKSRTKQVLLRAHASRHDYVNPVLTKPHVHG